ncbi:MULTISPECIES: hypothetical protein [Spiroplasma]|uniref:Uncharacterized protein n=1 Tax=Spiroplasma ixodetis TaxID=2141 RepID=A0ABM8BYU4_9MOLU|nr:hypothetical protein [Spiroplasma ixodetis]BDT05065.1 hypothetical protein SHM_27110 [Spiroplasma ixodetis]
MAIQFNKNLDNTEKLVEAPEFIEFYKQSNSPWASFFPIEMVNSTKIEFIVKKPKNSEIKVLKWNDKSKGLDVSYAETVKILKEIKEEAVAGEIIANVDLNAENGQNLLNTMQYEVANDLADYLANNDTNVIAKYATKIDITDKTPLGYLKSMLDAWNTLFQLRNSNNCRFFITNNLYDTIVYLANNKGLITDNQIAQQLRLNGNDLYIKGVLCQIVMDDYMTFTDNNETKIMSFVLATPRAMKRYMLQNTVVYVQDIADGKVGRRYLVGGEVTGESIPYITDEETTSRWMLCAIVNNDKNDLKTKITSLTTDITANVNNNNSELNTQIKSTNELKSLNPNLTNPTIKYFSDAQGKTNVSNQKQKAGDLYITITANVNDLNYKGTTNPIKITLK